MADRARSRGIAGRAAVLSLALLATVARAAPLPFDLKLDLPPVIEDSTRPRQCTIAFLVQDTDTNDIYGVRMQVAPAEDATPVRDRMPCPTSVPPRMAARALDACTARAADPNSCVFADTSRGFEREPQARNTAENTARCASDLYNHIALACWKSGELEVCNVACGQTADEARGLARGRCEAKHQQPCAISGSLPILAP